MKAKLKIQALEGMKVTWGGIISKTILTSNEKEEEDWALGRSDTWSESGSWLVMFGSLRRTETSIYQVPTMCQKFCGTN